MILINNPDKSFVLEVLYILRKDVPFPLRYLDQLSKIQEVHYIMGLVGP